MRYTIKDFNKQFKSDADCLRHIFNARYPEGLTCEKCSRREDWYQVLGRRAYACKCGHQIYPTADTIFHKSPTALKTWFFAIFLFTASKNGVAAKELQRQLGVTYKCAWRIGHQIRKLMREDGVRLGGVTEIDETYVGGVRHGTRGRGAAGKTPLFGLLEREGAVKVRVVKDTRRVTLTPIIHQTVEHGSSIMSDEHNAYDRLGRSGYRHERVNHKAKEYVRGEAHTNSIEGFWSQLKRSINGTHHSVSRKHLQKYANEFAFRYNRRKSEYPMFDHVLGQLVEQPC